MWWSPKMALPNFSFPHIYGLPKYIHIRKWSLFLPFESGLIPLLLWPFRRLENPCLELETSASSLVECSFLGFSLLGTQLPYGEMSKWHEEANEGELGTLVNSSFCAPSWQTVSSASHLSQAFWMFQTIRALKMSPLPVHITWSRRITQPCLMNQ